jgi:hypothetical protein
VGEHRRFDRSSAAIPCDHPSHRHLQLGSILLFKLQVALRMDVCRGDRRRRVNADVSRRVVSAVVEDRLLVFPLDIAMERSF